VPISTAIRNRCLLTDTHTHLHTHTFICRFLTRVLQWLPRCNDFSWWKSLGAHTCWSLHTAFIERLRTLWGSNGRLAWLGNWMGREWPGFDVIGWGNWLAARAAKTSWNSDMMWRNLRRTGWATGQLVLWPCWFHEQFLGLWFCSWVPSSGVNLCTRADVCWQFSIATKNLNLEGIHLTAAVWHRQGALHDVPSLLHGSWVYRRIFHWCGKWLTMDEILC
jgi:hypothetical protein